VTKLLDDIEPESNTRRDAGLRIEAASRLVLRYGLVLVIGWIGLMKFTRYEAKGIEPWWRIAHLWAGCIAFSAYMVIDGCGFREIEEKESN
jgi:hypothetical protein